MTVAEENASANHSVEKKQGREDSSVVNVHLNGCDEISSSGSTVNSQTSNSDSTSDGMVNLQPSTNDHASGDGSTPNPQPSSSNHSSESDSTALPSCSDRNSVIFSATLTWISFRDINQHNHRSRDCIYFLCNQRNHHNTRNKK